MYQFKPTAPGTRSQFASGVLLAVAGLLGGCGGGGGGGPAPPANVTISGRVTFDLVPVVAGTGPGAGLDYAATAPAPVRGATVQFVAGGSVLASGTTGLDGSFSLSVPANRTGRVRVLAEVVRSGSPAWDFRVVDNTAANSLYALDGTDFSTGTAALVRDLHAASGWTGAGYGAPRAAAPFAILDAVQAGVELIVSVDASIQFPPLVLHWSTGNIPSPPEDGFDIAAGEIVSTLYSRSLGGIFILGAANVDTDEYDRHVILHEWAHYLERAFARSDTIGGPHGPGDILDMRVAFSEGLANALAAIAAGDPIFKDAQGQLQQLAPAFDLEGSSVSQRLNPGWFSEASVHEVLYDIVDADQDGADALNESFASLFGVLTGRLGPGVPLTSIFALVDGLKSDNPAAAPLIDALVVDQSMTAVADAYGAGELNDGGATFAPDVLPVYRSLTVGGAAENVCSTNEFGSGTSGLYNKLATRRLLRFGITAPGTTTLSAVATSIPAGAYADPDLQLHAAGPFALSETAPSAACTDTSAGGWVPADCREDLTLTLAAGDYVLEVYEFTNTLDVSAATQPIGRTCFDVSVTQP